MKRFFQNLVLSAFLIAAPLSNWQIYYQNDFTGNIQSYDTKSVEKKGDDVLVRVQIDFNDYDPPYTSFILVQFDCDERYMMFLSVWSDLGHPGEFEMVQNGTSMATSGPIAEGAPAEILFEKLCLGGV